MEGCRQLSIIKKIQLLNNIQLYLLFIFLDFAIGFGFSLIFTLIDPTITESLPNDISLVSIFWLTVIIGPLIETFIFQYAIIEISLLLKAKPIIAIALSAIAFGTSHYYNVYYIFVMFITGLLYALNYILLKQRAVKYPVLIILSIHSIYNFVAFIVDDVYGLF